MSSLYCIPLYRYVVGGATYVGGIENSYDMQNVRGQVRHITELQAKILKHICTTKNSSYLTITRCTHRGRVTVLQSLDSLVRHRLVAKEKIYPDRKKSKLTFRPTQKGMSYSLAYLDTDVDEIQNAHADAESITDYNRRVKTIRDYSLRRKMTNYISRFVLEEDYFLEDGSFKSGLTDDINFGLRFVLYITRDRSFEFGNLFDLKIAELARSIYSVEEQRVLKKALLKLRDNLDLNIKQLPD